MKFESPGEIALSGIPVLVQVLDVPRSDGRPDLVVGVEGPESHSLVFFTDSNQLFQNPEVVLLDNAPVEVARVRLGAAHRPTLAVAAGYSVLLLSELGRRSKETPGEWTVMSTMPTPIHSIAAGQFDTAEPGEELAVLGEGGELQFLAGTGLPCSKEVQLSVTARDIRFVKSRVAAGAVTPLVVLDKAWGTARVLTGEGDQQSLDWLAAGLGNTVTVLPMRLNGDGSDDLVILSNGAEPLQVVETQGGTAFLVNLESDESDFSTGATMDVFHCDIDNDPENGDNCTLRAALQQANVDPGPNTIVFSVDQIIMERALPRIRQPVTVDGMAPKQGRTEERVEIDAGSKAFEIFNFDAGSEGSVIRGMVLRTNFGSVLKAAADNVTMEGNYIATDRSGMNPMSLGLNHGINLTGSDSTVGGASPEARNILGNGVEINGGTGNTVLNNYIGTDADGLKALGSFTKQGSRVCGVTIAGSGNDGVNDELPKTTDNTVGSLAVGKGNLISGNFCGIELRNAPDNLLLGNWIGTDHTGEQRIQSSDGTPAPANSFHGIDVQASNRTEISHNVVVASGRDGIRLASLSEATVSGNHVGVDASGTVWDPDGVPNLGNRQGLVLESSHQNLIGGTDGSNLIAGNRFSGLVLNSSDDNELFGNLIEANGSRPDGGGAGVTISGSGNRVGSGLPAGSNTITGNEGPGVAVFAPGQDNAILHNQIFGNGGAGVEISGSGNRVGSGLPAGSNTIAGNEGPGVAVIASGQDNAILHNQIFGNAGLGIDLGDDGPTENDGPQDPEPVSDADQGPNSLQNFPVLTELEGEQLTGFLESEPSTLYRLEFYSSEEECNDPEPDPEKRKCNNRGQGGVLRAVLDPGTEGAAAQTDETGRLDFSVPLFVPPFTAVTATATKISEVLEPLATSEFSPRILGGEQTVFVVNSPRDAADPEDRVSSDLSPGDGICATGGTISRGGEEEPECTLRAAIEEANAFAGRDRIHFDIPGGAEQSVIRLASLLPEVQSPVEIDAATQPRDGDPDPKTRAVAIEGEALTGEGLQSGLAIRASGTGPVIKGLELRNFDSALVVIDAKGSQIRGNDITARFVGIAFVQSQGGNMIGGQLDTPLFPEGVCVDPCNRVRVSGRKGTRFQNIGISIGPDFVGKDKIFGNWVVGPEDDLGEEEKGFFGIQTRSAKTIIGEGTRTGNLVESFRIGVALRKDEDDDDLFGSQTARVRGNWLINPDGREGIGVEVRSKGNVVGGTLPDHANRIKASTAILVLGDSPVILSNVYVKHDPFEALIGGFPFEDSPLLQGASLHGETLTVRGQLSSLRSTNGFRVQVYRSTEVSADCDFNDELIHVGDVLLDTDGAGHRGFRRTFDGAGVPLGAVVMATATIFGDTSSFSLCQRIDRDQDGDGVGESTDADDQDPGIITIRDPLTHSTIDVKAATGGFGLILGTLLSGERRALLLQDGREGILPTGLAELEIVPQQNGAQATPLGLAEAVVLEWATPEGLILDSFYNFGPTAEDLEDHFYEFLFDGETGAEIFEDRILLHYVDGGRGDHDLTVNGEILTRGGPVTLADRFYFPQVGDGLVGNIQLQTSLVVQNTRGITPVTLELFNSESGFLTLDLDPLGRGSLFGFGLNPGESVSAQSEGTGDIQAGYAEILAALGVGGTAVFSRSDAASGTLLYEAGVPATQPLTDFTLFVDSLGDRETGLAVAFPTAGQEVLDPAELTLRLYDNEFNELASTDAEVLPGHHFARFITQLFSETAGIDEMQGTVTVSSTEPVVAVTLRQTDDPQRGFPEDVPILTTFPVIPARADLGLAGQGDIETIFFPQIGNGIVADIRLQTELIFVNSSVDEADFTLEFFDSTGGVQAISLTNSETDSRFDLNLGAGEALTLETNGAGPIQVGYTRITGPVGLGGTAVFRRSDNPSGTLLYEAGVPASKTLSDFSLVVDNRGARDTGLAIVVPPSTKSPAQVTIRLYDTEFNLLAEDTLDLAPGSHLPRFASELFPEVEGLDNLEGTLTVSSTQPIAAITIRQNDEPALQFPTEVPTLATFPVIPGRSDGIIPSRQ